MVRRSCLRRPYYQSPPPYAYYRPYPYYNYFYGSGRAELSRALLNFAKRALP
jgi:hypothetical protein